MVKVSGFVTICLIITLGYGCGLLIFLTEKQDDRCEMTYMFEYPQFVKISHNVDKKYRKYGLYAYSEGRLTEKARNMYFDGIPVLFIPGNAGSLKQVRSLSSIALRKSLNSRIHYHFDYFTLDLNEELTGLYGPLLYDQLHFVNSSLYRILDLYKQKSNKPESVIIIGHSVGGIIALKLVSEISDSRLVPLVITLATPLKRPPLLLDYHIANFYDGDFSKIPENTTIVSLSGGYRDYVIPTYLSEKKSNQSLYAVTTNVPMSWIEANHIQIVWCKQVIMAVNRALFDSIDPSNRQISLNSTSRQAAFHHHLIHHSGTKIRNREKYSKLVEIDNRGEWSESVLKRYSIKYDRGVRETRWHMVRLSDVPGYEMLTILAVNLETVDWIFACNANFPKGSGRICSDAIHLSHLSEIAPSMKYKRRYFQINMRELKKKHSDLTHVVFRVFPTNEPVTFHVDVHALEERSITADLPRWWSFQKHVFLERTEDKSLHYELGLPLLQHIVQFYQLYVEALDCSKEDHHATASLVVPWSNENFHSYFTRVEKNPMNIRLYSSKPNTARNSSIVVKLTLDPSCKYRISIKNSLANVLAQMCRNYTPLLLTNMAAVTLMSLRFQLKSLEKGYCSVIFSAISEGAKPYYVLTASKIISQLLSSPKVPSFLPKPDMVYLAEEGTELFVLPLLLFLCSVGIVWMCAIFLGVSLIALESTVHKLALKLLARTVSFNIIWSDYLIKVLHKVPVLVASALVVLSVTTCGGLALCLGAIFYFLRLTQMSQDFVEEVVWFFVKKLARECRNFFKRTKLKNTSAGNNAESTPSASIQPPEISDQVGNVESDRQFKLKNELEGEEPSPSGSCGGSEGTNLEENAVGFTQEVVEEKGVDVVPDEGTDTEAELPDSYNSIFFHSTLFFMWCMVTLINIPAVLTWARNFKYSTVLTPDDSFIPGLSLSLCALALWQCDFPKTDRKWLDKLGALITLMAVTSLIFATISLYRLNYILTLSITMVTLHQLLAPKLETQSSGDETSEDDADDGRVKYDVTKSKIE